MREPADETRCQAEFRSGSFMTFGPRPLVRCKNVPIVILTEKLAGSDGETGSMSLCTECFEVFQSKKDVPSVHVKVIERESDAK